MAIQEAALELFVEHGYGNTTLKEIAELADVAPRTLTHHFPAKHDLLFAMDLWTLESLKSDLESYVGRKTVFEIVRSWYFESTVAAIANEGEEQFWNRRRLRAQVIRNSADLQGYATASFADFEELISSHLGRSYSLPPGALAPKLAAISIMGGLREIHYFAADSIQRGDPLEPMIDEVFSFAEAGMRSFGSRCRPA